MCRPSDAEPEYAGDEEEGDYEESYDEKPYNGPPPVIRTKSMIISAKVGETVHLPCQIENGGELDCQYNYYMFCTSFCIDHWTSILGYVLNIFYRW